MSKLSNLYFYISSSPLLALTLFLAAGGMPGGS